MPMLPSNFSCRVRDAGRGFGGAAYEVWGRIGACVAATLRDVPDVAGQVAELRKISLASGYASGRIHADLLDAWRLMHGGDKERALACLGNGLALLGKESEGFLWGGVPQILQPLCVLALSEGVQVESACSVIRVFRLTPPPDAPESWPWPLQIRVLGGFDLSIDGKPLPSRGKSKHRQLELVKLVAAHAPAALPLERIAEILWPDSEGDAARHALETTLSRLRTTFGRDVFRLEQGALGLDRRVCWIDARLLEDCIARLEACIRQGVGELAAAADAVCQLYRGDLFAGDSAAWLMPRREYWRGRVSRLLGDAAYKLATTGDLIAAGRLLERAVESDPYSEPLTASLMRIYLDAGRYAEGLAVYRRFRRIALSTLGTAVSADIEGLASLLQAGKV
jgi:LuxR family maltose regulon positive regulatory protein